MLGKIEGRRRRDTENEIVGWHHWLNGHEFEHAPGVGDRQGSLASCRPQSPNESNRAQWLNRTLSVLNERWQILNRHHIYIPLDKFQWFLTFNLEIMVVPVSQTLHPSQRFKLMTEQKEDNNIIIPLGATLAKVLPSYKMKPPTPSRSPFWNNSTTVVSVASNGGHQIRDPPLFLPHFSLPSWCGPLALP